MPPRRPNQPVAALAKDLYEARQLKAQHRYEDALALYQGILTQHPECAEAIGSLGHTLGITGKLNAGTKMVDRALAIDPDSAELHHFRGHLDALRIRPEEALVHFNRALEIEPKRVQTLTLAAQCCDRLNRKDDARAYADRAIAAKRTDPEANLVLASLEAKAKNYEAAKARLNKLIGRRSTPPETHHRALTELGFVLDKMGDYDNAYDAFDRAGAEIEQMPITRQVSRTLVYDRLDAYKDRVTPELVGRFAGETFDTPAPAFLVGFPRSGTTMTEQVIAAHPGVVTSDEHQLLDPMGRRLMEGADQRYDVPGQLAKLDKPLVEELRRIYWDRVADQIDEDTAGKLFLDKLPLNIIDLPMINTIFPDAKVIVALRDPRDCCLSCFMQYFRPNPAMVHLLRLPSTVDFYAAVMGHHLGTRGSLTLPSLEVRYEDTVSDLESQGRRIIDHLGLDWDDGLLHFQEKAKARAIRTPSYEAVTEKVHTRAIGRWANYRAHFEPLAEKLGPFLSAFGYSTSTS